VKVYLDSSAIVKLVQHEPESAALRRYLRKYNESLRVTSALARVEVVRAVLAGGPAAVAHARRQLGRMYHIGLDLDVLDQAATLAPAGRLRSLDAVHLAAAQVLGDDLQAVVTYDERMADAAAALRMPVTTPR
jgi:predicted nucleic acid-binding protein